MILPLSPIITTIVTSLATSAPIAIADLVQCLDKASESGEELDRQALRLAAAEGTDHAVASVVANIIAASSEITPTVTDFAARVLLFCKLARRFRVLAHVAEMLENIRGTYDELLDKDVFVFLERPRGVSGFELFRKHAWVFNPSTRQTSSSINLKARPFPWFEGVWDMTRDGGGGDGTADVMTLEATDLGWATPTQKQTPRAAVDEMDGMIFCSGQNPSSRLVMGTVNHRALLLHLTNDDGEFRGNDASGRHVIGMRISSRSLSHFHVDNLHDKIPVKDASLCFCTPQVDGTGQQPFYIDTGKSFAGEDAFAVEMWYFDGGIEQGLSSTPRGLISNGIFTIFLQAELLIVSAFVVDSIDAVSFSVDSLGNRDKWVHVRLVYKGTGEPALHLFVNGVLKMTQVGMRLRSTGPYPCNLVIGASCPATPIQPLCMGAISHVLITKLTEHDPHTITCLHAGLSHVDCARAWGYWPLDASLGGKSSSWTLRDASKGGDAHGIVKTVAAVYGMTAMMPPPPPLPLTTMSRRFVLKNKTSNVVQGGEQNMTGNDRTETTGRVGFLMEGRYRQGYGFSGCEDDGANAIPQTCRIWCTDPITHNGGFDLRLTMAPATSICSLTVVLCGGSWFESRPEFMAGDEETLSLSKGKMDNTLLYGNSHLEDTLLPNRNEFFRCKVMLVPGANRMVIETLASKPREGVARMGTSRCVGWFPLDQVKIEAGEQFSMRFFHDAVTETLRVSAIRGNSGEDEVPLVQHEAPVRLGSRMEEKFVGVELLARHPVTVKSISFDSFPCPTCHSATCTGGGRGPCSSSMTRVVASSPPVPPPPPSSHNIGVVGGTNPCPNCTLHNPIGAKICSVCDAILGGDVNSGAIVAVGPVRDVTTKVLPSDASTLQSCPSCTYKNVPYATICEMCQASLPASSLSRQDQGLNEFFGEFPGLSAAAPDMPMTRNVPRSNELANIRKVCENELPVMRHVTFTERWDTSVGYITIETKPGMEGRDPAWLIKGTVGKHDSEHVKPVTGFACLDGDANMRLHVRTVQHGSLVVTMDTPTSFSGSGYTGRLREDAEEIRGLRGLVKGHPSPPYTGLFNMKLGLTNVCYSNSVIQALYWTEPLRMALTTNSEHNGDLASLFKSLSSTRLPAINPKGVQNMLSKIWSAGEQMDASDFLHHLLHELPTPLVNANFLTETVTATVCLSCETESVRKEEHVGLNLSLPIQFMPITDLCVVTCSRGPDMKARLEQAMLSGGAGGGESHFEFVELDLSRIPSDFERLSGELMPKTATRANMPSSSTSSHWQTSTTTSLRPSSTTQQCTFLCISRNPDKAAITDIRIMSNGVNAMGYAAQVPTLAGFLPVVHVNDLWDQTNPLKAFNFASEDATTTNLVGYSMHSSTQQWYVALLFRRDTMVGSPITEIRVIHRQDEECPEEFKVIDIDKRVFVPESVGGIATGEVKICIRKGMPITDVVISSTSPSSANKSTYYHIPVKLSVAKSASTPDALYVFFSNSRSRSPITNLFLCDEDQVNTLIADNGGRFETCGNDTIIFPGRKVLIKERGHGCPIMQIDMFRAPRIRPRFTHLGNVVDLVSGVPDALPKQWHVMPSSLPSMVSAGVNVPSPDVALGLVTLEDQTVFRMLGESQDGSAIWDGVAFTQTDARAPFRFVGRIFKSNKDVEHIEFQVTFDSHEIDASMLLVQCTGLFDSQSEKRRPFHAIKTSEAVTGLTHGVLVDLMVLRAGQTPPAGFQLVHAARRDDDNLDSNINRHAKSPGTELFLAMKRRNVTHPVPDRSQDICEVGVCLPELDGVGMGMESNGMFESNGNIWTILYHNPDGSDASLHFGTPAPKTYLCIRRRGHNKIDEDAIVDLSLTIEGGSGLLPEPDFIVRKTSVTGAVQGILNVDPTCPAGRKVYLASLSRPCNTMLQRAPCDCLLNGTYTSQQKGTFVLRAVAVAGSGIPITSQCKRVHWRGSTGFSTMTSILEGMQVDVDQALRTAPDDDINEFRERWGLVVPPTTSSNMEVSEKIPISMFFGKLVGGSPNMIGLSAQAIFYERTAQISWIGLDAKKQMVTLLMDDYFEMSFSKDEHEYWDRGEKRFSDRQQGNDMQSLLNHYFASEILSSSMPCMSPQCQGATRTFLQRTRMETLPPQLIMSIKGTGFNTLANRPYKIVRQVKFDVVMKIDQQHEYALYAVVVHDGLSANSGHYFTFARSCAEAGVDGLRQKDCARAPWCLFNDAQVVQVEFDDLVKCIHHSQSRTPYLLFYCRLGMDSLGNNNVQQQEEEQQQQTWYRKEMLKFVTGEFETRTSKWFHMALRSAVSG